MMMAVRPCYQLLVFSILILFASIYLPLVVSIFQKVWFYKIFDNQTCPYCYGDNLCDDIYNGHFNLSINNLLDVGQFISTKNVYKGLYKQQRVFVKKLADSWELSEFDKSEKKDVSNTNILKYLNQVTPLANFKSCDKSTSEHFLNDLTENWTLEQIWTIIHINIEPLIIKIFNKSSGYAVPNILGYCGRSILQEDSGEPLNVFTKVSWIKRAYLAVQLLKSAVDFTFKHPKYRIYLTDMSSDNVAVQKTTMKLTFIDLENAVLDLKEPRRLIHYSNNFQNEYAFSQDKICDSSISDHNIFSVCKLFLSKNAPWPMMKNGLLHNPPISIWVKHRQLFKSIKYCVISKKRFYFSKKILISLQHILHLYKGVLN